MKIRAAILEEMGLPVPFAESKPLQVEEIDLEGPGPGEVMIRIAAAGICHSDLSTLEGIRIRPLPMVLGHEASGVVEEVGPDVHELKKGDHVVAVFLATCGHCDACVSGRPTLCVAGGKATAEGTLLSGKRKVRRGTQELHHHSGISSFAEYATVSERSLVKVDPELPLDEAAIFGCAVLTGVGAAVNAANITLGSTVAVIGLGGVGLAGLLGVIAMGAARIIAIDTNPSKLETALDLGATEAFNAADEDLVETIRETTGGGVQTVLEFAGAKPALDLAYAIGCRGGEMVTVGLPHPSTQLTIPALSLVLEERTVRGSYMGSSVPSRDLRRFIDLYQRGRLPVDKLLTHKLPLDEINEGMDRLREGRAIRQIVTL
jgi:alcohol dehydrogenase